MQENTNKAIAINSLVLYGKMFVLTICGLLTTRFSLQALGVVDYGLFAVLGGIISFIGIINTIQLSTSNRYIAVAIGKGDVKEINAQFNVNLFIHIGIAAITAVLALPLGSWYVLNFVHYDGEISTALIVFIVATLTSIISFIGVPYNGLLMAKERFTFFSLVEIACGILKLFFTYLLITHWDNKLIVYSLVISFLSCFHVIAYFFYCRIKWHDIVSWNFVRDKKKYKDVFSFSGWIGYGAVAVILKSQGAALIVNMFFNTVMNTALGLANTVNAYLLQFAGNITQPIAPQITKNYAAGNNDRVSLLLVLSTRVAFLVTFLFSVPFLINADWILNLWLGEVPPYTVLFLKLLIIDSLVSSFNSGISSIILASGKIKLYQLLVNTIKIISVIVAYFALKTGFPAYSLFVIYIVFSLIIVVVIQYVLNRTVHFDNRVLFKQSYVPSIIVVLLFLPFFLVNAEKFPFFSILGGFIYSIILIWVVGMKGNERRKVIGYLKKVC